MMKKTRIEMIEKYFIKAVSYISPIIVILVITLTRINIIPLIELQEVFASWGLGLLIFLLFIKPLYVIPSKYLQATSWSWKEGLSYLLKGWTKDPIAKYIRTFVINTIYSITGYAMKFRRQLGILSFRCILLHCLILEITRYQNGVSLIKMNTKIGVIMGFIGLIGLFIGFITSNNRSIRILKKYRKTVQRVAYIAFLFSIIHLIFIDPFEQVGRILLIIAYIVLKMAERKKEKITPPQKPSEKKQEYKRRLCKICGYIYDERLGDQGHGIAPGTTFEDIPEDRTCPLCGVGKKDFVLLEDKKDQSLHIKTKILNHKMLTPTVFELTLQTNSKINALPGQWILFHLDDGKGAFERAYSIVQQDIHDNESILTFVIKINPEGRGSKYIESLTIGEQIYLSGPFGEFAFKKTDNPKVCIASGTGLAPLYNMMNTAEKIEKTIIFTVPTYNEVFYEKELERIPNTKVYIHLTKEKKSGYKEGRFNLNKYNFPKNYEFYLCGNPIMVKETKKTLKDMGYKSIFTENF